MFTKAQIQEAYALLAPFYQVNGNRWETRASISAAWVPCSVWEVKEAVEDTLSGVDPATAHPAHHHLQAYYRIRYLLSADREKNV